MLETLRFNGDEIAPGADVTVDLLLPKLYTHTRLSMPVRVIRGRKPGPRLLVSAAVHGDEINGVEIIRRLLAAPALKRLRGTLIAVPVVNVMGFIANSRYLPDRRDLNRSFPGSGKGSIAGRLANLFREEVMSKATHMVDLHTGAIHRSNLPQVRADLSQHGITELAQAFGTPVIIDTGKPIDGSIREAASQMGVPALLYEAGEALRFDEISIRGGVRGILSLMRELEMLPAAKSAKRNRTSAIARSSRWMRAPQSGIMRSSVSLGAHVNEGETLAMISDPFGELDTPVLASTSGIVIGRTNLPLANEGDALFHIASVAKPGATVEHVEVYHEQLTDARELEDPTDSDRGFGDD